MQRYSSYKDSGVKWLGEIPSHWEVLALKHVLKSKKDIVGKHSSQYDLLSLTLKGIIKRDMENPEGKFPTSFDTYQVVYPNDFIFCNFDNEETPRAVGLSPYKGMITGAYDVLFRKNPNLTDNYLIYYFLYIDDAKRFKPLYKGLRKTVPFDSFMSYKIPVPPLSEQDAIVSYLDTVTSQIDTAISQQQKMIDLLNERKQIIINNAVTKGLDPNVKMKDSGVDWIGEIPEGWEVRKLKFLLKNKLMYGANESAESENESYPRYIRITDIDEDGNLRPDTFRSLSPSKAEPYLLKKGDLLFARSGATAGKTYLFKEDIKACFAGYLIKAGLNELLMPEYLNYYTKSGIYDNWKNGIFIQATIPNIGADKYSNMQITLPSKKEQNKIIKYLDVEVDKVNAVVNGYQKQITLLQERKQIIINDVVTGKVKVS
ncbi:MAG: restriction endonuclease subunit S [Paludibacteraceae bacterium]|nr:restriction endonuclease subunit S [Paludibacteraceae bacterium]